jgi:hypothetical protein
MITANKQKRSHYAITKFTQAVQIKLWQFTHSFEVDFSKPEHKFLHQSLFAFLKADKYRLIPLDVHGKKKSH